MDLQRAVLCAIDLALAEDLRDRQVAEQLAHVCAREASKHEFDVPSLIWGFVVMKLRDPDYLASERRITELGALREGRAGPQYIFITLDTEYMQGGLDPTGQTHLSAAEQLLSALVARQPPPYERIAAAFEAYTAWQMRQDPRLLHLYALNQVWAIIAKTDVYSLPRLGYYSPIGWERVGVGDQRPSVQGLLKWAIQGVEFLRGKRTMTLCWEYTSGTLHYHML